METKLEVEKHRNGGLAEALDRAKRAMEAYDKATKKTSDEDGDMERERVLERPRPKQREIEYDD